MSVGVCVRYGGGGQWDRHASSSWGLNIMVGDHRNKELQIRTNLRNRVMEALDIGVNVVRHDIGRIE